MDKCIAIITARGGSKRIPRKNIRLFYGFPIIKYSIEAAIKANCFDEIMVSTDDEEIAKIASDLGANVPFFRSEQTSSDHSSTEEVIYEVLKEYRDRGIYYDFACCIYPTAPFMTIENLKSGLAHLKKYDADSVIPVTKYNHPVQRALIITDNKIAFLWPEHTYSRTQDLETTYHDVGQFYWLNVKRFMLCKCILNANSIPLIVQNDLVQDIDSEEDWRIAELKYAYLNTMVKKGYSK